MRILHCSIIFSVVLVGCGGFVTQQNLRRAYSNARTEIQAVHECAQSKGFAEQHTHLCIWSRSHGSCAAADVWYEHCLSLNETESGINAAIPGVIAAMQTVLSENLSEAQFSNETSNTSFVPLVDGLFY